MQIVSFYVEYSEFWNVDLFFDICSFLHNELKFMKLGHSKVGLDQLRNRQNLWNGLLLISVLKIPNLSSLLKSMNHLWKCLPFDWMLHFSATINIFQTLVFDWFEPNNSDYVQREKCLNLKLNHPLEKLPKKSFIDTKEGISVMCMRSHWCVESCLSWWICWSENWMLGWEFWSTGMVSS